MSEFCKDDQDIDAFMSIIWNSLRCLPPSKQAKAIVTLCAWSFESYVSQKSPRVGELMLEDLQKIANKYRNSQPPVTTIQ